MNAVHWINGHIWILFSWYAVSLFTAAFCLVLHMRKTQGISRHLRMIVAACVLAAVGCILAGMQAGDTPFLPSYRLLPWVRFCWSSAATLVMVTCFLYLRYGYRIAQEHGL